MIIPAEWKGRHKHDAAQSKDVEQLALLALEHVEEAALGRASCLQKVPGEPADHICQLTSNHALGT
jgi:hypothetical protein